MLELVLLPNADLDSWDSLLEGMGSATVYHRRTWLEGIARMRDAKLIPYAFVSHGRKVGVLPLFVFRRGLFRVMASPPPQAAAPVLGPAVEEGMLGPAFDAIAREMDRLRVAYCELRLDGDVPAEVLERTGFEREPRSTFILDLSSGPEELWRHSLGASCRRAVRKAQAAGLRVEEIRLGEHLDRYFALAEQVFARRGRLPPLSREDYGELARVIEQSGCAKVLAVMQGERIIAAGIFPFGNGTIYYLDGVSDGAAQAVRPNNLLHWEVIRRACGEGLSRYDMVGAGIPGVARFKRTFGPEEAPYTYCYRVRGMPVALARRAYAFMAPSVRSLLHRVESLRSRGRRGGA